MKKVDITRALRDPEIRASLTESERAQLPAHPAGISEIADEVLRSVAGGCGPTACNTCPPPDPVTWAETCIPPNLDIYCF